MKWFVYFLIIFLYGLITFFGLGPVLLADGTASERMITLILVIVTYVVITILFVTWQKRKNR